MSRIDENEFFRHATLRITGSLNIDKALNDTMNYLNRFMPVISIKLAYSDLEKNIGRIVASIRPDTWHPIKDPISLPPELWAWIREHDPEFDESPVLMNDIDEEEPMKQNLISILWPRNCSLIVMKLSLEGRRLGKLILAASGKNQYTEDHIRLITLLHEPFAVAMSNILRHQEILNLKEILEDDNQFLNRQMMEMTGTVIGADFGLREVLNMVRQVAPMNSPVLLMGETGVGKEVIAGAIHKGSIRRNNPFITVNCGAIPEFLIDSELFGHEKGAFTGAISRKRGRFERAHTGTIFLDEIGELPLHAQVRLLRVVQNMEIERVGGTETIPIDVRIIAATHRNLEKMVRKETFREDLWFRLNVFPITIPPLRKRTGDIPALVNYFIEKKCKEMKRPPEFSLPPGTMENLKRYHWPGNVRELENLVERALIRSRSEGTSDLLNLETLTKSSPLPVPEDDSFLKLDEMIMEHITKALSRSGGKIEGKKGAAALLGLNPSTLRGKMRKLGIRYGSHSI